MCDLQFSHVEKCALVPVLAVKPWYSGMRCFSSVKQYSGPILAGLLLGGKGGAWDWRGRVEGATVTSGRVVQGSHTAFSPQNFSPGIGQVLHAEWDGAKG